MSKAHGIHLSVGEADEEGWQEVVLEDASPVVLGHLRVVEGTEEGPVVWWDARVVGQEGLHSRRFTDAREAILALAIRSYGGPESKEYGWQMLSTAFARVGIQGGEGRSR
jgi:hypothetical protein